MKKRMLLVIMMLVLTCGAVLTGCGGYKDPGDNINLDIDLNKKPALKILMQSAGMSKTAFNESVPAQAIKTATGYNADLAQLSAVEPDEELNLAFIGKKDYDAIKVTKAQFDYLITKDVLLNVKPAVDKFGPNLKANISKDSWNAVTFGDKVYGIPESAAGDSIDYGLVFNLKHVQAATGDKNLPADVTEFKALLESLKTHYGNKKDYRPFGFAKSNAIVPPIAAAFGVPNIWGEKNGALYNNIDSEEMRNYVRYMADLKSGSLMDPTSVGDQDMGKLMDKFAQQQVSVIVMAYWNISAFTAKLAAQNMIDNSTPEISTFPDIIGYVPTLEGSDGAAKKWRSGGLGYVTVFPFYMNKNTGYAIDYLDKKIKTENFRSYTIGQEGVNYKVENGEYIPLHFSPFENASYYLTGSDEANYPKYWQARIKKSAEMYRMWEFINRNAAEQGVYNPARNAPPLMEAAKQIKQDIELDKLSDVCNMISNGYSDATYNKALAKWKDNGGKATTEELNKWFRSK